MNYVDPMGLCAGKSWLADKIDKGLDWFKDTWDTFKQDIELMKDSPTLWSDLASGAWEGTKNVLNGAKNYIEGAVYNFVYDGMSRTGLLFASGESKAKSILYGWGSAVYERTPIVGAWDKAWYGTDVTGQEQYSNLERGLFAVQGTIELLVVAALVQSSLPASKKPGSYTPDRKLPRTKHGDPISDVNRPHTQLGRNASGEPAAREWMPGKNGNLNATRRIDFTDHGTPNIHPNPHQHTLTPNNPKLAPKGGYVPGKAEPLQYP